MSWRPAFLAAARCPKRYLPSVGEFVFVLPVGRPWNPIGKPCAKSPSLNFYFNFNYL
ncbi:hypothetical protein PCLA_19r0013 [Pseudomonas citronellolis]|nr:hypothetical protein PCLA_19r0013 [Pseudomonas citronellolis]